MKNPLFPNRLPSPCESSIWWLVFSPYSGPLLEAAVPCSPSLSFFAALCSHSLSSPFVLLPLPLLHAAPTPRACIHLSSPSRPLPSAGMLNQGAGVSRDPSKGATGSVGRQADKGQAQVLPAWPPCKEGSTIINKLGFDMENPSAHKGHGMGLQSQKVESYQPISSMGPSPRHRASLPPCTGHCYPPPLHGGARLYPVLCACPFAGSFILSSCSRWPMYFPCPPAQVPHSTRLQRFPCCSWINGWLCSNSYLNQKKHSSIVFLLSGSLEILSHVANIPRQFISCAHGL